MRFYIYFIINMKIANKPTPGLIHDTRIAIEDFKSACLHM